MTCSPTAQGKWSVPHFTAKGRVEAYVKEAHASMLAVFLAPGFFYSNIVERFPSRCERLRLRGAVYSQVLVKGPYSIPSASLCARTTSKHSSRRNASRVLFLRI
jgi:hypothetical protein